MNPNPSVFSEFPATPQTHFRLFFYAAMFAFINHFRRLGILQGESPEDLLSGYPFLYGYLDEMLPFLPAEMDWEDGLAWWQQELEAWEATADPALPLIRVRGLDGIHFHSLIALMLVGLVETDSRLGALIAQMQPLQSHRPCVDLLGQILRTGQQKEAWNLIKPLVRAGLAEVENPAVPRAEWILRIPSLLWDAIQGEPDSHPAPFCRLYDLTEHPGLKKLITSPALRDQLLQIPTLLQGGEVQTLVLRGPAGSDRLRIAGALTRACGWRVLEINSAGAGSEQGETWLGSFCTLTGAVPVQWYTLGPGETAQQSPFLGYEGPIIALLGKEGGLQHESGRRVLTLKIPPLGRLQRQQCWQQALGAHCGSELEEIGGRFYLGGGTIHRVAPMAIALGRLNGRREVTFSDVQAACRTINRQGLDQLATPLEAFGTWNQLITSSRMETELRDLALRCQNRERLVDQLAGTFGGQPSLGVRALFSGPSGTGKTLAARILAAELGMDLYRVDLASVVNKYIGETEKNLHQVLTKAEELDVVLLLDEGDALMGKRTDVRSANDRYANLETDYLLQRLETYQGIVIITTNAGDNIDKAFQRRMDVLVNFIPPESQERHQLWALHLPAEHTCRPEFLEEIAIRCSLTGGQIRNAVLHATLLALDAPQGLGELHLLEGLRREYRKSGTLFPLDKNGKPATGEAVYAFLNVLSEG